MKAEAAEQPFAPHTNRADEPTIQAADSGKQPAESENNVPEDRDKRVQSTCIMIAAARAYESLRTDRLLDDPFASLLISSEVTSVYVSSAAKASIERFKLKHVDVGPRKMWRVAVRTKFFDDFVLASKVRVAQVVALGSGLDTRPYRLDLPHDLRWYECDFADVIQPKVETMKKFQPRCALCSISADLRDPTWSSMLLHAGFKPEDKTLWILEGLQYYIPRDSFLALLDNLFNLSPVGSLMVLDIKTEAVLESIRSTRPTTFVSGFSNPEADFLPHGWRVTHNILSVDYRESLHVEIAVDADSAEAATRGAGSFFLHMEHV